ncbi:TRAP transporter small permease [Pikeienuella sp. HZG-20]|uniref:TRAP transporter small permease n=1 Tax=Paludibacillus litoralis TaxID=3133267 RepID=UPI0030ECB50F
MKTAAQVRRAIFYIFETLAIAAFLLMLGSSVLQVFYRYVLNAPLMWTEELARLMCVLTTYFGSVVVLIAREHIRVEMIDSLLGRRGLATVGVIVDLMMAWFLVAVAYGCYLLTSATWTTFTASMAWFRTGYLYIAVGVAVSAMTLVLIIDIYGQLLVLAGRRKETEA